MESLKRLKVCKNGKGVCMENQEYISEFFNSYSNLEEVIKTDKKRYIEYVMNVDKINIIESLEKYIDIVNKLDLTNVNLHSLIRKMWIRCHEYLPLLIKNFPTCFSKYTGSNLVDTLESSILYNCSSYDVSTMTRNLSEVENTIKGVQKFIENHENLFYLPRIHIVSINEVRRIMDTSEIALKKILSTYKITMERMNSVRNARLSLNSNTNIVPI